MEIHAILTEQTSKKLIKQNRKLYKIKLGNLIIWMFQQFL